MPHQLVNMNEETDLILCDSLENDGNFKVNITL